MGSLKHRGTRPVSSRWKRSLAILFPYSCPVLALIRRCPLAPIAVLAVVLVFGGLATGCTSGTSSDATADSTTTAAVPTSSEASSSSPDDAPASREKRRQGERSVAQKIEDASIETRVKQALVGTSSLRIFPFRLTVTGGHLVLRGDVNTPDQYRRAERVAGEVEGVTEVTNRLTMGGQPVTEERLSSADSSSTEDASVYHTVRQGDTLWEIAREYRASVGQIRRLNDLRSSNLRPGQRIRVR